MKRDGFTLFEVVLALALLGISMSILLEQSAENTRRHTDRAARLAAHRTLRNEVQRLRASDPLAGTFPATYATDRSGNRTDAAAPGNHVVRVERTILCLGGADILDNASQIPDARGCRAGTSPAAHFTVRVTFPSRSEDDGQETVEQTITLWPRDRHGAAWSPGT